MPQGKLIAARFLGHVVQDAAPHARAEATGVLLLALLKDDLPQARAAQMVFHTQGGAQGGNRAVIRLLAAEAGVGRQRDDLKRLRVVVPQAGHAAEQRQGVLPAGDADRDAVPG